MRLREIAGVVVMAAGPASAATLDYFPLEVGNRWEYKADDRRSPAVIEVLKTEVINGLTWYRVHRLNGNDVLLRVDEEQCLMVWNRERKDEELWVSFLAPEGNTYSTHIAPCSPIAKIDRQSAPEELEVRYSGHCSDAGLLRETYVRSLGLKERTEVTYTGPVTWKLVLARIAGREQAL
jgi:hypothetical protein